MSTGLAQLACTGIRSAPARLLVLFVALLLSCGASARGGRDFRDRSVIGKWKLVSVLDIAAIASLDEAEAKTLLGKYVTISATGVKVDEEACPAPQFWAERIEPEPHIQEKLHSSSERLRLPNPAVMVELGCTDVYIRSPRELVLLWGGAMFEAVRIIPAKPPEQKSRLAPKRPLEKAEPAKAQPAGKPTVKKAVAKSPPALNKAAAGARKKPTRKAGSGLRNSGKNRLGT
jgi:hypothetical protein